MPMPLSSMVSVLASLSAMRRTRPSKNAPPSSVSERKRFLSHASAAFEISSRRKMSCHARAGAVRTVGNAACAVQAVAIEVAMVVAIVVAVAEVWSGGGGLGGGSDGSS